MTQSIIEQKKDLFSRTYNLEQEVVQAKELLELNEIISELE